MLGVGCGPQVGPFPSRPIMGSIRGEGTPPPTNTSCHLKKERSNLPLKWLLKEGRGWSPTAAAATAAAAARLRAAAATTAANPCPGHGSSTLSLRRRCPQATAAAFRPPHRHHLHLQLHLHLHLRASPPRFAPHLLLPSSFPSTVLLSVNTPHFRTATVPVHPPSINFPSIFPMPRRSQPPSFMNSFSPIFPAFLPGSRITLLPKSLCSSISLFPSFRISQASSRFPRGIPPPTPWFSPLHRHVNPAFSRPTDFPTWNSTMPKFTGLIFHSARLTDVIPQRVRPSTPAFPNFPSPCSSHPLRTSPSPSPSPPATPTRDFKSQNAASPLTREFKSATSRPSHQFRKLPTASPPNSNFRDPLSRKFPLEVHIRIPLHVQSSRIQFLVPLLNLLPKIQLVAQRPFPVVTLRNSRGVLVDSAPPPNLLDETARHPIESSHVKLEFPSPRRHHLFFLLNSPPRPFDSQSLDGYWCFSILPTHLANCTTPPCQNSTLRNFPWPIPNPRPLLDSKFRSPTVPMRPLASHCLAWNCSVS